MWRLPRGHQSTPKGAYDHAVNCDVPPPASTDCDPDVQPGSTIVRDKPLKRHDPLCSACLNRTFGTRFPPTNYQIGPNFHCLTNQISPLSPQLPSYCCK